MTFLDAAKEILKFIAAIILAPFVLGMWCFSDWWEKLLKMKKKERRWYHRVLLVVTAPLFIFWPLSWLGTKVVEDF